MTTANAEQDTNVEYVDVNVEVGIRVQSLMFRHRQKQSDLGNVLGVDASAVSKKLRGITAFSVVDLMKIGRAYGVGPAELLPELDSNQQPSGYTQPQVSEALAAKWDAHLDFYAGGWISEEKGMRERWLSWCCPGAGGLLDGYVTSPRGRTWSGWVGAISQWDATLSLSGSTQA